MIMKICAKYVSTVKIKLLCRYAGMHFAVLALKTGITKKKKITRRVLYAYKKWI